jgi:hypothetical protein
MVQGPSRARRSSLRRRAIAPPLLAALLCAVPSAAAAQPKTDVLMLANGDRITCQIMSMSRGKLDAKTDDAGRVSIDWIRLRRVISVHVFEIDTSAGTRHFSALPAPPDEADGVLMLVDGTTIPIPEVVSIVPVDEGLASRLSAYLDVGFTLAKANATTNLTSDGMVGYRGERMGTNFQFEAYLLDSDTSEKSVRTTLQLTGDYYVGRWTLQTAVSAERNDELSLDLRLGLGAGATYTAIQTNFNVLTASAGLSALQEHYQGLDPSTALTAYVGVAWDAFRYQSPKLDAGISLVAYPYLTDPGRVRFEGSARVKYEVFRDFNVGLNLTASQDNRPPEAAPKSDYVAAATIGWSYRH